MNSHDYILLTIREGKENLAFGRKGKSCLYKERKMLPFVQKQKLALAILTAQCIGVSISK